MGLQVVASLGPLALRRPFLVNERLLLCLLGLCQSRVRLLPLRMLMTPHKGIGQRPLARTYRPIDLLVVSRVSSRHQQWTLVTLEHIGLAGLVVTDFGGSCMLAL